MAYNPNRLQFVHHDECFATAELAKEYISSQLDKINRPALYAEPMVLKYGDESNPNIILAIGSVGDGETPSVNNKTFFIDSANLEKSIAEIEEELKDQKEAIEKIEKAVKTLIESCGLNEDGTYKGHIDDAILKTAKSLDEADTLLSEYILELEKKQTLNVKDTKTIDLTLDKTASGQTLSADVTLADHKTVEKVELPNIILIEENGLFTNVDLTYDEKENDLTFSVNGESKTFELPTETYVVSGEYDTKTESIILHMNTGAEVVIDVRKLIGEWTVIGEFTDTPIILTLTPVKYEDTLHGADLYQDLLKADVRIADEDTKPFNILKKTEDGRSLYVDGLAKNIKYLKNGEMITVQEGLDNIECKVSTSNDNNIYKRTDGLFSYSNIEYNASTNVLTFIHSNVTGGTTTQAYTLNSAKLLDDVSYDSSREVIILRFTTADGKTSKVEIPVADIITEWEVDNSNNTVTLVKTRSVAGTDKLSANVNISTAEYNIVENNGHAIYVRGTADNIRYDEDYTVEGKIKSINTDLNTKIDDEITRAKEAEQGLSDKISGNTELIKNETVRATSAETALDTKIEEEITRATKEEESLETQVTTNASNIANEVDRATKAETGLAANISANTKAIKAEEVRATSAETALQTGIVNEVKDRENAIETLTHSLDDEVKRAEGVEQLISGAVNTNIEAIANEVDRATKAEIGLAINVSANTKAIKVEEVRATSAETALQTAIGNEVKDRENAIETLTHSLDDEVKRAEGVEQLISGAVENEIATARSKEARLQESIDKAQSSIDAEKTRAEGAEKILENLISENAKNIDNERIRAISAETEVKQLIKDETERANDVEKEISGIVEANTSAIETEVTRAKETEKTISGIAIANKEGLEAEISRATEAENDINVTYDTAANKLTFVNSKGITTSYTLSQASLIDHMEYISATKTLRIYYKNSGTQETTYVDVSVADLFNQIEVDETTSEAGAIHMTLEKNTSVGNDILAATVKLSTKDTNLLVNDNGNLYASNQASDIKLGDGTDVADAIATIKNSIKEEASARKETDKSINDALEKEIKTRLDEVTELSGDVTTLKVSATTFNTTLTNEIVDRKLVENNINAEIQSLSGKEASDSAKITVLEASASTINSTLNSEIANRTLAESQINSKIDNLNTKVSQSEDRITVLEASASTINSTLNSEVVRATSAETALQNVINENTKNIATNTANIAKETERAIKVEEDLTSNVVSNTEAIKNEIIRAISAETALQDAIEEGSVKISKTDGNIITLFEDGIYAKSSKLTYDTGSNTLYFTPSDSTSATSIVLNSIDTIKDIYFDGETDELVFKYTVSGEEKTVRIKAAAFFKGIVGTSDGNVKVTTALTTTEGGSTSTGITANLDVNDIIDNTASTVKLSKNDDNEIVANVNVAKDVPHNILQIDGSNSSLFVAGTADNITATYKDKVTDVQTVISEISSDVTDLQIETAYISGSVKDMLVILNEHTKDILVLSGDLKTEIENRTNADKFISGVVDNNTSEILKLKARVDAHDIEINTLKERVSAIESAMSSGFSAIWKELERLDKKATLVDDVENDYITHTFSVIDDPTSADNGKTNVRVDINEDLGRNPDTGSSEDF